MGASPLVSTLRAIGQWMDRNPAQVVTIVFEDHITPRESAAALAEAGLTSRAFHPSNNPDARWPTLGQMISSGKTLVTFSENYDGPSPSYRDFFRYGMETPFDFSNPDAMSCAPNRGGTGKELFMMNNWVTRAAASRVDAGIVNQRDFIVNRARECASDWGRMPTIVAVDFGTIGDPVGAAAVLNGLTS